MEETQNINERATETRGNGSQIYTEPFSENAIGRLKHLVVTFYNQGERKYYAIAVDGETVVPKNSDGRKFNRYLQFVNEDTKTVEVKMFQGYSPNCNKYLFVLNKGLSGVAGQQENVQAKIEAALKAQEIQNELEWLRTELEKKDKKIRKQKKMLENSGINMVEVNKFVQEGKGILGALGFGINSGGVSGIPQEPEAEVEVEIETEGDQPHSEEQEIYHQLVENVGKKGIKKVLRIMTKLSQHPELESKLDEVLNNKNKTDGQA